MTNSKSGRLAYDWFTRSREGKHIAKVVRAELAIARDIYELQPASEENRARVQALKILLAYSTGSTT